MHLEERHQAEASAIMKRFVPGYEVWAYGSRVHGRHLRKTSDLDLCIRNNKPLEWKIIGGLKEAFSESDLPFFVDVVEWVRIPEWLREKILAEHEVLAEGTKQDA